MHKHWEELIPFYVAGTLTPKEVRALENHLVGCEECRQQMEDWRSIAVAVWQTAAEDARGLPPLSKHVLEAVRTTSSQTVIPTPPSHRIVPLPSRATSKRRIEGYAGQWIMQFPLTLAAAVTVVLVIVGLLVYMSLPYDENGGLDENDGTGVAALSSSTVETETPAGISDMGLILTTPAPMQTPMLPATPTQSIPVFTPIPTVQGVGGGSENDVFALSQPGTASEDNIQLTACYALNIQREIVNIYTFPGIQYDLVDTLNPGDRIEVFTAGSEGWYQTIRPNVSRAVTGWIDGSLVELEGLCNDLPTHANAIRNDALH